MWRGFVGAGGGVRAVCWCRGGAEASNRNVVALMDGQSPFGLGLPAEQLSWAVRVGPQRGHLMSNLARPIAATIVQDKWDKRNCISLTRKSSVPHHPRLHTCTHTAR